MPATFVTVFPTRTLFASDQDGTRRVQGQGLGLHNLWWGAPSLLNSIASIDLQRRRRNGRPDTHRSYAASTYPAGAEGRKSLTVVTETFVKRILWNGTASVGEARASGIELVSNGTTFAVNAAKDVLVASGTIQSPQILRPSSQRTFKETSSV